MRLWKWMVEHSFPGTYGEYLEAKTIHLEEIKKYRKKPQFIAGLALFFIPVVVLLFEPGWKGRIIGFCLVAGELLVRDTISEHYCALINRERKTVTT